MMPPLAHPKGMSTRRFPGHPGSERSDFIEADVGGKTDTALTGAAHGGVKDAITGEDFELAIVHADGNIEGNSLSDI